MGRAKPKWKRFEELAARIQRELTPNAAVTLDDRIPGKLSGTIRKIDVSIRHRVEGSELLIAMECKDLVSPVDLNEIATFIDQIKDIGANKGVMVSSRGFTKSAKTRARNAGLSLYRLIDAEKHDWRSVISIPVLCEFRYLRKWQLTLLTRAGLVVPKSVLVGGVLQDSTGKIIGKVSEIMQFLWARGKLPSVPGTNRISDLLGTNAYLKAGDSSVGLKISAIYLVSRCWRLGNIPLIEIAGFEDQLDKKIITKKFTTGDMDASAAERDWELIQDPRELAVKPTFITTMLKHVKQDCYTAIGLRPLFK